MVDILGADISAGSGLLGSAINAISANVLANKQFKYSQQLADQQNQYNLDFWRMNNEYNSPSAQMKRFADAGLNPNLIYGQGNAGNSSHAPQAVVANPPDYSGVMSSMSRLAEAVNIAKSIQEYRSLKLSNDSKQTELDFMPGFLQGRNYLQDTRGYSSTLANMLLYGRLEGYAKAGGRSFALPQGGEPSPIQNYFANLYSSQLGNIQRQIELRQAQKVLYDLNIPYLRTRNAWQPWQYGISAGADVLGGLLGFKKLLTPGAKAISNFNRINNYY